jgi:diguanylate cyclase (GGDEF)-like protein/PAS domain S-box-containing protein
MIGQLREIDQRVRTEQEIANMLQHYRLVSENSSDIVYRTDPDSVIEWISPNVVDVLGWTWTQLAGRQMGDLVHPDDRPAFEGDRARLDERGQNSYEARLLRADGSYLWLGMTSRYTYGPNGDVLGRVGSGRIVQEEVEAREAAARYEQLLRAAMRSFLDPHALYTAVRGGDGRIVDFVYADVNDAMCTYLQMSHAELADARVLQVSPDLERSELMSLYSETVETGRPLAIDGYCPHRDGRHAGRRYDIRAVRVGDGISCTWRDVTDRHEAAERMAVSERRFRLLAENSTDVVLLSRDGIMRWLSPSLTRMLGWDPAEWEGHAFEEFTHPEDVPLAQQRREEILAGANVVTLFRLRDNTGDYHWVEVHSGPYLNDAEEVEGIVASFRTVDHEVATNAELERLAKFDTLTGLLNRHEAMNRLQAVTTDRRVAGRNTGVLFCDVDQFKSINDGHGHAAGDQVLRIAAERIVDTVRSGDTVARIGGDEILIILPAVEDLDAVTQIAEKIRAAVSEPIPLPNPPGSIRATMSIGATITADDETADELLARADDAMYRAKSTGRNQVVPLPGD